MTGVFRPISAVISNVVRNLLEHGRLLIRILHYVQNDRGVCSLQTSDRIRVSPFGTHLLFLPWRKKVSKKSQDCARFTRKTSVRKAEIVKTRFAQTETIFNRLSHLFFGSSVEVGRWWLTFLQTGEANVILSETKNLLDCSAIFCTDPSLRVGMTGVFSDGWWVM